MKCHDTTDEITITPGGSIALVGQPNVGKSAVFHRLTGKQVAISNYPGTTVDIARGAALDLPDTQLVDTPGVISLPANSEDEFVTARVLLNEPLRTILQVGDAKNLRRTLLLSVQLAEMGLPMVLALNMMDEANSRGIRLDIGQLSGSLSIPVIPTTAIRNQGIDRLVKAVDSSRAPDIHIQYPAEIETAVEEIGSCLNEPPIAPRALALLWLAEDTVAESWLQAHTTSETYSRLQTIRQGLQARVGEHLPAMIQKTRIDYVDGLAERIILNAGSGMSGFAAKLGQLATHPTWGLLILVIVLAGLYGFVGVFGAGTLVDLLELRVFGEWINPWITRWVNMIPVSWVADLLVGEYGLWTMGITYALALILPIVTTFFLAFGIMEDSGYLPRLAALSNRLFSAMGLNGKAVLPMVLGLGCVTMATMTTRVLESKRERFLVTLLLALAIPCSAQLGVVMGMLAGISLTASLIWGGAVFLVLLAVGWLAARLIPGDRTPLLVEIPPMRLPQFSNVLLKTLARLEWYLKEVVPLFLLGTIIMFALDKIGILGWLIQAGEPLVKDWLGLPAETSAAFLMGFLRRDFGAAGLFIMQSQGLLNPLQVVVAMVTITLFIPCIASVMVIAKERGWKTATGMIALIFPLAFFVGGILNRLLLWAGWSG